MKFSKAFDSILAQRHMSLAELSERADVLQDDLKRASSKSFDLNDEQVRRIADELAVPVRALYTKQEIVLSQLPDFRRKSPTSTLLDRGVIHAIGYVEKVSLSLADLDIDLGTSQDVDKYTGPLTKSAAKILAEKWRKKWGITNEDQLEWGNASKLYYSLRSYIENLGIFVMHYQFGTDDVAGLYAKVDGGPHTILINTRASGKARKLFTLAHEFCHVLLREDGVSNPSIVRNKIEVFCNHFAACLLAPEKLIRLAITRYNYKMSLAGDSIKLLSEKLGISQQASVLRLVDIGVFEQENYGHWISRFSDGIPTDDKKDPIRRAKENDPIKGKVTQYGRSFLKKLSFAKKEGLLDALEIYKLYGIKPVYQNRLLGG